jgi:hypothetical protein
MLVSLTMAACSSTTSSGNGTTTTTTATTTTAAKGSGQSPSAPIPLGQTGSVDGWTVKVVSVVPETTDPVTSTTAAGYESLVYTMEATGSKDSNQHLPLNWLRSYSAAIN